MEKQVEFSPPPNFIRYIIDEDLKTGKHETVVTRFPPEPNGYLHIGHAKSICLNFGLAADYQGRCHLRFDDTNPTKEEIEYIESIQEDVKWLGFDWGEHMYYASDYFDRLYDYAEQLIRLGKAYVDDLTAEEIRAYRGTLTESGKDSPWRDRSVEENLDLFRRMRDGEFADGEKVLRAKIDMASPNLNLRDPAIFRIRKTSHHRTGDQWCIYPLYDYTHCLSDMIEGVTHSICTLEFEDHRPLYDWVLDTLNTPCHPQQIEFARLNLNFAIMSKRRLLQLVTEGTVTGWDDPRMPTISGLRRRGYTPASLRNFCERIGVAKKDSWVDMGLLENSIREDLNTTVPRVLAVMNPLKVVIENWPEGQEEELTAPNFPDDPPRMGYRRIPFGRELYIDRDDFMETPYRKFFRLAPGREVRLRWGYIIRCESVVKNAAGEITELRCTYDPETRSGEAVGRKVKGTIHWVSAAHAFRAPVRLYDRLFRVERPGANKDLGFRDEINPDSLTTVSEAMLEPSLAGARPGDRYQFERQGYFFVDPKESREGAPVFNRIVTLKDTWAKLVQKQQVD